LNYPSFSLSRRVSSASSRSTESFWCVGEATEELQSNTQAIPALNVRQQESFGKNSRLRGVGTTPWANHVPENCKLCSKLAIAGLQELCETCESAFKRSRAPRIERGIQYPESEWQDDIRPTPPLKDRKTLSMRREGDLQHHFQVDTDSADHKRPPPAPLKDMEYQPNFEPIPSRQFSETAQVEDDDERYLNWKTSFQRDELEKTQSMFEHWSLSFENDDLGNGKEDDKVPSIKRRPKAKKEDLKRDTNFYRFYGDVLEDH
jgi:hypothetical protein